MTRVPCQVGDRIRLIEMQGDTNPIPPGSTGIVVSVADLSAFHQAPDYAISVDWDDIDRSLSLIWPVDSFEVIDPQPTHILR